MEKAVSSAIKVNASAFYRMRSYTEVNAATEWYDRYPTITVAKNIYRYTVHCVYME